MFRQPRADGHQIGIDEVATARHVYETQLISLRNPDFQIVGGQPVGYFEFQPPFPVVGKGRQRVRLWLVPEVGPEES